jgi:2-polyprenyl-3-methyl-5-hydroxy-6-metoxy-1,4-benzoquinol methylase
MSTWLKRQRARLDDDLARRGLAHTFSLARFTLHAATQELIDTHASGDCLDVGSGRSPYRDLLAARCKRVVTLDVERRTDDVDLVGDIQNLEEMVAESFDTVVCTQVLEHIPRPWAAMSEMHRVLRPGGKVIISVPHLSALHELPHDYFRFTEFGLRSLATGAGLQIVHSGGVGGLVSMLTHGVSYIWLTVASPVPAVRWLAWGFNYLILVRLAQVVDRLIGMPGVYPCNCLMVGERPLPEAEGA